MADNGPARPSVPVPFSAPLPSHPRGLSVSRPPPGGTLCVAPLNFEILSIEVHWELGRQGTGRDRPCTGPSNCPFCSKGQSVRWQGWIAGLLMPTKVLRLVPITRYCWDHCPALREANGHLRGRGVKLTRLGNSSRSAVLAELVSLPSTLELPPCPNMEDSLGALWGMPLAQVDAWRAARRAAREISSTEPDQHLEGDPF